MPQKKTKKSSTKSTPEKGKKPVKPVKGVALGAALKKAAKDVGKKLGIARGVAASSAKKPKLSKPVKAEGLKKPELGKTGAVQKKKPFVGKEKGLSLVLIKGKKGDLEKKAKAGKAPKLEPVPAAKLKNGKGKELVLEVPAPRGVDIIKGPGKKNGRAPEAGQSAKAKRCREPGCDHDGNLVGYCRLHYIKNWRRIKRKEAIIASGQLNNYVEELVNKYPDKYLDVIRQDLASEKEWSKVVTDLELESTDDELGAEEDIDAVAEGVRSGSGGARGEFDDEGDVF